MNKKKIALVMLPAMMFTKFYKKDTTTPTQNPIDAIGSSILGVITILLFLTSGVYGVGKYAIDLLKSPFAQVKQKNLS